MRHPCPLPGFEEYWIELPDKWLGRHASAYAEAAEAAREKGFYGVPVNFAGCLATLDNWKLPGFDGNPAAWNIGELDLGVMVWVTQTTKGEYDKCFVVPKGSLPPSSNGETAPKTPSVEPTG